MGWLHDGLGGRGPSRCVHGTQFWEDKYKECPHCRREADERQAEWDRKYREERERYAAEARAQAVPLTPDAELEIAVYGPGGEGPTLLGWESPGEFLARHPEAVLYQDKAYSSRDMVLREYGHEVRSTRPPEPTPKPQA